LSMWLELHPSLDKMVWLATATQGQLKLKDQH
jgi:hypothetical protein